jgi:serine/threonine protein kinase
MAPSEDLLFRDGLGDRLILRDSQGRPAQECLLIRSELASIPAFDFALNERLWLVEKFDHPAFLTVRNIARENSRLTSISLIHDLTGGTRLSDVLAKAASGGKPISAGATVFVLKEVLDGLAELHRQSGDLAHGAIAPERIVLADGKVRIADYVLGPAIEQLRFTTERYWKELRVAVPSSAGGARLDRRVDVVQAALMAVAMFAGRPLRDTEHLGGIGDVLMSISVPQPIRSWLLRALHMDPRRVFVHAGEASQALGEAMKESGLRPAPADLDLQQSRSLRIAPAAAPRPVSAAPAPPPAAKPTTTVIAVQPAGQATKVVKAAPAPTQKRDVWQAHDVDPRQHVKPARSTAATLRQPVGPGLKKFVLVAIMIGLMTVAFTAAQYVPAPEWMFSQAGTLVIESNPQGVKVSVNGKPQGVTPLTLKVQSGLHEVEVHGPGRPKVFKVHVTRGDRVAQYVEFPGVRR